MSYICWLHLLVHRVTSYPPPGWHAHAHKCNRCCRQTGTSLFSLNWPQHGRMLQSLNKVKCCLLVRQNMPGQQGEVQEVVHCREIEIRYINIGSVYKSLVSATLHRCKQMVKNKTWRPNHAWDVDFASSFFGCWNLYFTLLQLSAGSNHSQSKHGQLQYFPKCMTSSAWNALSARKCDIQYIYFLS